MTDRYLDIKESLVINGLKVLSYSYGRGKGSTGKTFSMTLGGVDNTVKPGDDLTVKGMVYTVTSKDFDVTPNGYTTVVNMVEKVASELMKKSPKKTLMFMSLTAEEKEEFDIANMDSNSVVDYSELEYIPLIRVCQPDTFTGGWITVSGDPETGVIDYLADKMGVNLITNVRPYWVKQVQADVASSFFDVITSLVNFFNPIVTIDGDTLYILQKSLKGGSISLGRIGNFKQTEVFNYNNKVTYVKVVGGLGKWERDKFKGTVDEEKEITITNTIGQETGQQIWARFGGTPADVARMLGSRGEMAFRWLDGPSNMSDTTIVTEKWRLDPFGNFKVLLEKHQVTHNLVINVDTLISDETYEYEFLPECFDRPRQKRKIARIGKYEWEMSMFPDGCYRRFKEDVDWITEAWFYAPNGNLLHEAMTRESNCLILSSGGIYAGETMIELNFGDNFWIPDGETSPFVQRRLCEESITRYRQQTPTMYEKTTYHRSIGALRRRLGDGNHSISSDHIRGKVPKYAPKYRTMQVYAEKVWGNDPMAMPAFIISNSNIIDWADAAAILEDILKDNIDFDYTVQRTYVMPAELEADIGWSVDFPETKVGINGVVQEVDVTDGHIASYSVAKDAQAGTVQTTLVVEGKVSVV